MNSLGIESGRRWLIALAILALVLQGGLAGIGALYNETDGQYAGAARVMVSGGDWLIPENNGIPRLVKPPLLVWMLAGSMEVFGINEFAARLPGALAVVVWVLGTAVIAAKLTGTWRTGFLAGAVLLTSLGTFTMGRIIMPEPAFAAAITWAMVCGLVVFDGDSRHRRWAAAGFWIFAGIACMTKGWHGLIYPGVILAVSGSWVPEWRPHVRRLISVPGILLFLAICVPWHVAAELRYPGFLANLLFVEQAGHLTGSDAPATSYSVVPRGQFLLLHLGWFFPWSLAAIAGVGAIFLRRRQGRDVAAGLPSPLVRLVTVWIGIILLSVLLAGQRQDYYAMTLWPAVAIAIAASFSAGWPRVSLIVPLGVVAIGSVFFAWILISGLPVGAEARSVADRATAWTTLTGLDAEIWRGLAVLGFGAFVTSTMALVATLGASRSGTWSWVGLIVTGVIFCVAGTLGTGQLAPYFSLAPMEEVLRDVLPEDAVLVYEGGIDTASSLLFYSDRVVHVLGQNPNAEFATRTIGIGRDRFVSGADFQALWRSKTPVGFITERSDLIRWASVLGPLPEPVATAGTQVLLRNPLPPAE